jgi:Mg-chelatase subunit ChlD
MIADIRSWCYDSSETVERLKIPTGLLTLLLSENAHSEEQLFQAVLDHKNQSPKYMDIPFNPPQFPFDNAEFQDPFYLVEDAQVHALELGALEGMGEQELKAYLKSILNHFATPSGDHFRVKKRKLLEHVGRQYFVELFGKRELKAKIGRQKHDRNFLPTPRGSMDCIHISSTMRKSVLRRKIFPHGLLLAEEDIVHTSKKESERTDILVALDSSKSMGQIGKLENAKKATLSFYYYKSRYFRDTKVDFVAFNDKIEKIKPLDLLSVIADGMTYTATLLDFAFDYFKATKNRKEFYLITDGYPQHEELSNALYHAMTLKSAEKIRRLDVEATVILLSDSDHEIHHKNFAFNKILCDTLKGRLIVAETDTIATSLINEQKR